MILDLLVHEALLRAERQKEELTALLVHDLRGPAAGIMMSAQSRLKATNLPGVERELWGHVYAAAEVINRMVLNLLDIARSEDGVFAPRRTDVDVTQVVGEVQLLMAPLAQSRGQQVITDMKPGFPRSELIASSCAGCSKTCSTTPFDTARPAPRLASRRRPRTAPSASACAIRARESQRSFVTRYSTSTSGLPRPAAAKCHLVGRTADRRWQVTPLCYEPSASRA